MQTLRVTLNDESGEPVVYLAKHLVTWQKRDAHWKVVAEGINRDSPSVHRYRLMAPNIVC
jgi:hypothetical protein